MGYIKSADVFRQCGECCAIIDDINISQICAACGKVVATEDADLAALPNGELPDLALAGLQVILIEERPHCNGTQFQTDYFMPLLRQPEHVQAFTAQRHEYPAAVGKIKAAPEASKEPVNFFLVKVGLLVTPALLPECVVATAHVVYITLQAGLAGAGEGDARMMLRRELTERNTFVVLPARIDESAPNCCRHPAPSYSCIHTRLRPEFFAAYMASSARLSMAATPASVSTKAETPIDTVKDMDTSCSSLSLRINRKNMKENSE